LSLTKLYARGKKHSIVDIEITITGLEKHHFILYGRALLMLIYEIYIAAKIGAP
jgi:hypothetical protein